MPVIGLVQVGEQAMADRFTYLPQIGLSIALIWAISDVCRGWPARRWAYAIAATCALAVLSAWGWRQASFWSDSETLCRRDLACTSLNGFAHLGCAPPTRTGRKKRWGTIGACWKSIRRFRSSTDFILAEAYYNLGVILAGRGRFDEAMAHYRQALEAEPNHADGHNNLASFRRAAAGPRRRSALREGAASEAR